MSRSQRTVVWNTRRWVLVVMVGIAWGLHVWGIRRNLPFIPEVDEPPLVMPAVHIAASGDLNPHWFGNPGSTVIYPLAVLYRVWHAISCWGMSLGSDPNLQTLFDSNASEFYLLGRLLTITYAVIQVPLVYHVGRKVFGARVGLVGAWLSVLSPVAVTQAQMVRTDSAAAFFGMLSLWSCFRLYAWQAIGKHIMAGLAIGLSIATRYFMATLVPVLLVIDGLILWSRSLRPRKADWLGISAGLLVVIVAFALSTPYFFLDFPTALRDLSVEARSTHLGADGLSRAGNLVFYVTVAIPLSITWPLAILAAAGVVLAVRKRKPQQVVLLGFLAVFLVGISLSPLHWVRWSIQILPPLVLFAAHALDAAFVLLSTRLRLTLAARRGLMLSMLLLVSVWPAYQLILMDIRQANPSTRILAREWIASNLPASSKIAQEAYTAPLAGTGFVVFETSSLAERRTLDDYRRDGYRYLVVSSAMYDRYMAEPDRYPTQVAFYRTLFSTAPLLQQFEPSATRGGPVVRIYKLRRP